MPYCVAASYFALIALALLFIPVAHPDAGLAKKRLFWVALNVILWCGYVHPCRMLLNDLTCVTAVPPLLMHFIPLSRTLCFGLTCCGWVLFWMFLSTFPRETLRLQIFGFVSGYLGGCFILGLVVMLFLYIITAYGSILLPILLVMYVLFLLRFRVRPLPKPTPKPKPQPTPEPKPEPTPREENPSVAVRALILSGVNNSNTYAPDDSTKRTFLLPGHVVESLDGGSDYPTIIGMFTASPCGRVWTFLPSLPADWQMLRNEQPLNGINVLSAGDTLTLQRADSPDPAATLHVSFRILLASHRNG